MDKKKQKKWNQRYLKRDTPPGSPEPFLINHLDLLKPGSILDLACGDGRNAIYLSQKNFSVTGVDFAQEGLKRLEESAKNHQLRIPLLCLDLEQAGALVELESYDNILVNHYKPAEHIWPQIETLLKPEGILLVCTFNIKHAELNGFSRKFCLEENELVNIFEKLKLLHHESFEDQRGFLDGYVFKKILNVQ